MEARRHHIVGDLANVDSELLAHTCPYQSPLLQLASQFRRIQRKRELNALLRLCVVIPMPYSSNLSTWKNAIEQFRYKSPIMHYHVHIQSMPVNLGF